MNTRKTVCVLICNVMLLLTLGCMSSEKWLPEHNLPAGCENEWTQEAFSDIDLPHSYNVLPDESFTYICPWWNSIRIGRLVLIGDTRRDTMVKYYTHSLESLGWTLVEETSSQYVDSTTLKFRKPAKKEVITLTVSRTPMNLIKIDLALKPE